MRHLGVKIGLTQSAFAGKMPNICVDIFQKIADLPLLRRPAITTQKHF
jgi:hypothetical protein